MASGATESPFSGALRNWPLGPVSKALSPRYWNDVDVSSPTSPPDLLVRVAHSAARRPTAVAVEADDATLTYEELVRATSCLAGRLAELCQARGPTQPRVGVSLPRGATELVALLATLEAGAAYVPLDPSHPLERLRLVLEDAAPDVMIVHPRSPLFELAGAYSVIAIDDVASLAGGPTAAAPRVEVGPEALAYVMFTSGSTGRPKGVEVTRGAVANFLRSMAHTPGLTQDDRLLAVTTTGFDIAGLELYLPLWVGATVVIADVHAARDPRLLRERLERGDVSVMQATPATWRMLLDAGWQGGDASFRMLCGGEALPRALADRLLATGGELWNMYGPTETTIWSSLERIAPGYDQITVGRPIDATQMVVLDEALQPLPPGVDGELAIGGSGLARGYFGRPELTAERFIVHAGLGQRLYRTGDLCRELPDGRFEWRGRLDQQVKIRGHRVELGEIEARLGAVPGVSSVVVVAYPQRDAEPSLCTYWVGTADRAALVAAARRWLPPGLVPTAWVRLAQFPLNTNGKVDRKQLPRPEVSCGNDEPIKRPTCDAEARIAAIWCEVLRVSEVPIDRDFFVLGGTSVLAVQVAQRLEDETGVAVPLRALFEAPTIEQLARYLQGELDDEAPIVVRLRAGASDRPPLHCVLGVHLYQDLARALHTDREVIGMHVPLRWLPRREPMPLLEEIAARYLAIVRARQPQGPYHLLGLCFGGVVAYEVARQLEAAGERVATVTIIDAVLPSAVQVDTVGRVRNAVEVVANAWRSPHELRRRLRRRARQLAAYVGWSRIQGATKPVELPIDGPQVEAEIRRFDATPGRIDARLLVVRATVSSAPSWQIVGRDHGWGGRARVVRVHDVTADHLGVMREPHVHVLAHALEELLSMPLHDHQ